MVSTVTFSAQTTVFTPPADCNTSWTYEGNYYNSVSGGLLMQNVLANSLDSSCFPSRFTGNGRAPSAQQVYSPYVCPSGYATPGVFNNAGTTTAICCPSKFSFYSVYSTINFGGSQSVLFQGCISTFRGTTTVPARSGNADLVTSVVTGPLTMWGQPVIVQYQSKDLSLFSTASSTTLATSTATSASASVSTSTGSGSSNNPAPSSSSFPIWARAVTGVLVGLGVIFMIALAGFLIRRHRKKKAKGVAPPNGTAYDYTPGQPPAPGMVQKGKPHGLYEFYSGNATDGRQEIAGKPLARQANEMDGTSTHGGSTHGGSSSATTTGAVGGTWNNNPNNQNHRPVELE